MKGFKVGLAVPKLTNSLNKNKKTICSYIRKAYKKGAKLIIFPECTVSGIIDKGIPKDDIKISNERDDEFIKKLCRLAKIYKINIALGVLEHEDGKFYDSLFFINDRGKLEETYRRISLWHNNDKMIYGCGQEYSMVKIKGVRFSFLICGDLFFKEVTDGLKMKEFDYLIYSVAVSFDDNNIDKRAQWEKEIGEYKKRIKGINKNTFMTNYIAPKNHEFRCYGGATVFSEDGEVVESLPILKRGILYYNI